MAYEVEQNKRKEKETLPRILHTSQPRTETVEEGSDGDASGAWVTVIVGGGFCGCTSKEETCITSESLPAAFLCLQGDLRVQTTQDLVVLPGRQMLWVCWRTLSWRRGRWLREDVGKLDVELLGGTGILIDGLRQGSLGK